MPEPGLCHEHHEKREQVVGARRGCGFVPVGDVVPTRSGSQSGMVNLVGRDYLLMTVNGTPKRIPFNQLQTKSRIRVDRAFREKMIEDMTLRKLAESRNKQE